MKIKYRIIITADTHLNRKIPKEIDLFRIKAHNEAFSQIIDYAVENQIDAILHCGDLFDTSRPWPTVVDFVKKQIYRLTQNNIQFYVCVPGSSLITMGDGSLEYIKDINIGDYVLSLSDDYKVSQNRVLNIFKRKANFLYNINTTGGFSLQCTKEHPILIIRNNSLVWANANELRRGDFVAIPTNFGEKENKKIYFLDYLLNNNLYVINPRDILKKIRKIGLVKDLSKKVLSMDRKVRGWYSNETSIPLDILYNYLVKSRYSVDEIRDIISTVKIKTHHGKAYTFPKYIPYKLFYLLGFLISDGSFIEKDRLLPDGRTTKIYDIRLINTDLLVINYCKEILQQFGVCPSYNQIEEANEYNIEGRTGNAKKIYKIQYTDKTLGTIFKSLGLFPNKKDEQDIHFLTKFPNSYLWHLIAGMYDGDRAERNKISLISINKLTIDTFCHILLRLGLASNKIKKKNGMYLCQTRIIGEGFEKLPSLRKPPIRKGRNSKTFPLKYKMSYYESLKNKSGVLEQILTLSKNVIWRKIVSIKTIKNEIDVYNLEIEKTHNFITNNIVTHNCRGNHDGSGTGKNFLIRGSAIEYAKLPNITNFHYLEPIFDLDEKADLEDQNKEVNIPIGYRAFNDDLYIWGCGYYGNQTASIFHKIADTDKIGEKFSILLLHFFVEDINNMGFKDEITIPLSEITQYPFKIVAIGHNHRRVPPIEEKGIIFLSPGSPEMWDFFNPASFGFYVLKIYTNYSFKFEFHNIEPIYLMKNIVIARNEPKDAKWYVQNIKRKVNNLLRDYNKRLILNFQLNGKITQDSPLLDCESIRKNLLENDEILYVNIDDRINLELGKIELDQFKSGASTKQIEELLLQHLTKEEVEVLIDGYLKINHELNNEDSLTRAGNLKPAILEQIQETIAEKYLNIKNSSKKANPKKESKVTKKDSTTNEEIVVSNEKKKERTLNSFFG